MVGGWSGLMGAVMLGPRIGRFKEKKDFAVLEPSNSESTLSKKEMKQQKALDAQHTLGNNVPFQVMGTFILWFVNI